MPLFEQFPYTNFHDLNLDQIVKALKALDKKVDAYMTYQTITYADPIQWNITTQYQKNTVVLASDGTAYLSTKPVPTNILITDTNYWTEIGNFSDLWDDLKEAISVHDEGPSPTATANRTAGDLVWRDNELYQVTVNMSAGTAYITGTNCNKISIEELIKDLASTVDSLGTSVTALSNKIDNLPKLFDNVHIVLAGDSNWASMPDSSLERLRTIMNATTSNISVGGAKWSDVYTQITSYSGPTPDIIIINALGSDILGNIWQYDLGGIWGAPDVRDHTIPDLTDASQQTTFNYMKGTYEFIRNTYPRAFLYVMVRANRFGKPRSSWYYLKFYEQQIAQEWGVPVIDGNNIMNITGFNSTQLAIFCQNDGVHYNTTGYNRLADVLAYMLESNGTISYSQMPDQYFVPSSEIDSSYGSQDIRNLRPMCLWVCQHCAPMYTNHWGLNGRAVAKKNSSFESVKFTANVAYNDYLEYDATGMMFLNNKDIVQITGTNYNGNEIRSASEVIIRHVITDAADIDINNIQPGMYSISDTAATALITDGKLPAGTAGGTLIACKLRDPADAPSANDNRMYIYLSKNRGFYVGSNWASGDPTWATVTTS